MDGWVRLHRILMDKPIWKCSTPQQKAILITLLLMVNHEDSEWEWQGNKFKVNPGQTITSLDNIVKEAGKGISVQNVRTALDKFEKYGFLTNKSTKTGRLITVENWELYQSNENNQQSNKQRGNKGLTPNKNDKNDKNIILNTIVEIFHEICASYPKVKKLTKQREKAINARLKDYTEDDFRKLFTMAEESNFLKGSDGGWKANFDWLINESNMVKVLEGNYANRSSSNPQPKPQPQPTKFNNHPRREYSSSDMSELEKKLLQKGLS